MAQYLIGSSAQEKFLMCCFSVEGHVVAFSEINKGSNVKVDIDLQSVIRTAILTGARDIAVAHNHPTGICAPSKQDINLTVHLIKALGLVDIELIDHAVVNANDIFSIRNDVGEKNWHIPKEIPL